MTQPDVAVLRGEARRPGGVPAPASVALSADGIAVTVGSAPPWSAAYRDIRTVAVDAGAVLLVLGDGPGAERWLFERFGERLGTLARGLRDGRLRQVLADGLVTLDPESPPELVEFAAEGPDGGKAGVAQLLYHERGVVLAPLDERQPWLRVRRADIGSVELRTEVGGVRVLAPAGRSLVGRAGATATIDLRAMGTVAGAHRDRWVALRDAAVGDAAAIVAGLVPDAPFGARRVAADLLLEGHPVAPAAFGEAWTHLEAATLGREPFAEAYRALCELGGGTGAARWLAAAPDRPGGSGDPRIWFLVGLPGNLVALELVSAGAHATYLFRVVGRASFVRGVAPTDLAAAVADVSEALIDARFLREPIALPAERMAEPASLRYRLALAALPSLAAARARFVGRIVHRDPIGWRAAVEDAIAWNGSARDDAADGPGRAAQEAQVDEAAGEAAGAGLVGPGGAGEAGEPADAGTNTSPAPTGAAG